MKQVSDNLDKTTFDLEEQIRKKADAEKVMPVLTDHATKIKQLQDGLRDLDSREHKTSYTVGDLKTDLQALNKDVNLINSKLKAVCEQLQEKKELRRTETTAFTPAGISSEDLQRLDDAETKLTRLKQDFDNLKKNYFSKNKEFESTMAKLASTEDLTKLDEKLLALLEDFIESTKDRFAGKNKTKSELNGMKSKLKAMFELLISSGVIKTEEDEQSDEETAMLSRKPLRGNSCVSCDKKLTALSTKPGHFKSWNKLPARDPSDRFPRAGQSFSKMLSMMQGIKTIE